QVWQPAAAIGQSFFGMPEPFLSAAQVFFRLGRAAAAAVAVLHFPLLELHLGPENLLLTLADLQLPELGLVAEPIHGTADLHVDPGEGVTAGGPEGAESLAEIGHGQDRGDAGSLGHGASLTGAAG